MKIIHDSNKLPSLIRKRSLTKEEQNLINILEADNYFEKRVVDIREKFSNNNSRKELDDEVSKLRNEYLLPYHWQPSLVSLVVDNILILPLSQTSVGLYPGIYCDCNPKKPHWHEAKDYALIGIEANITKKEFKEWVDKNWNNDIKPNLKRLPRHPKPGQEIIEIYKRIVYLRDQKHRKYKEIAELILKEFETPYSDNQISGMYIRFKTYLRKKPSK